MRNIISLEISPELKEKLKGEAAEREMSVSALIRWIIKQYFNKK